MSVFLVRIKQNFNVSKLFNKKFQSGFKEMSKAIGAHLYLVLTLRMSGDILHVLPLHVFMAWTEIILLLPRLSIKPKVLFV